MSKFSFNRETDKLVATRDFTRGNLVGRERKAIDISELDDAGIRHLVEVAAVAEIQTGSSSRSAKAVAPPLDDRGSDPVK